MSDTDELADALRRATQGPWLKHPSHTDPDVGVIEWTILNEQGALVATGLRTGDADLMVAARALGGEEGVTPEAARAEAVAPVLALADEWETKQVAHTPRGAAIDLRAAVSAEGVAAHNRAERAAGAHDALMAAARDIYNADPDPAFPERQEFYNAGVSPWLEQRALTYRADALDGGDE